jgi:hypothetical protein
LAATLLMKPSSFASRKTSGRHLWAMLEDAQRVEERPRAIDELGAYREIGKQLDTSTDFQEEVGDAVVLE